MDTLLAKMVPLAFGAAVSPVLLTFAILLLSSDDHPRARAFAYLAGGTATVIVIGIVAVAGSAATSGEAMLPSSSSATLDLILGGLLAAVGVRKIVTPPKEKPAKPAKAEEAPASLQLALVKDAGLGVVLTASNASSLVFYLAAAKETADSGLPTVEQIVAMSIVGLGFMAPVVLPLLATFVAPATAQSFLEATKRAVKKYGRYIAAGIALLFGVYLLYKGGRVLL